MVPGKDLRVCIILHPICMCPVGGLMVHIRSQFHDMLQYIMVVSLESLGFGD